MKAKPIAWKYFGIIWLLLAVQVVNAQSWPANSWSSATNLTSVINANGVNELSGLHFNPTNNRLYGVQDDGYLDVLQWNTATNTFSLIATKALTGGPEGITQANLYANEFYVIDENNYEIKRYTHTANFSTVTLYKHWNLLASPSPMQDTGNTGPEGIVFIPDSYLSTIGFISQQTGQLYTSTKGMGGLFFIANQDQGYVWVFDINPNSNDDFLYVGKYQTNRTESCDLAFDRSTGMLYILHNIAGNNKLEVTDLSTAALSGGERKFVIASEYNLANPNDANENIEGFAITPKCSSLNAVSAWLCRDVKSSEDIAIQHDVLRFFTPFGAYGTCIPLANATFEVANSITISPNPAQNQMVISGEKIENATIQIYTALGQLVLKKENQNETPFIVDVSVLKTGIYFLEVNQDGNVSRSKFWKE